MDHPKQPQIDRINELSQLARTAWFSLLGYLVFVGITLLGVRDADFFVPSRQTDLPLVGVAIPTASFFWTAPILGAALYTYLHLFLIKLWDAHGEARTADADPTHHWLVNDFVLIRQRDPVALARPLAFLTDWITRLLVWAAGPIVLAYAWWRSMPAHNEWLTLLIAACLWLTLVVGFTSWWRAEASLGSLPPSHWLKGAQVPAAGLTALLLVSVSWVRTDGESWLASANIAYLELSSLPSDWQRLEEASRDFQKAWCDSKGLTTARCNAEELSRKKSFLAEMNDARRAALRRSAALAKPDLSESDLRKAKATGVVLAQANLWSAQLQRADFWGARLDGAYLSRARLDRAILSKARLQAADLSLATLERANFVDADLSLTDLAGANLALANLRGADLNSADLTGTDLRGADLRGVKNLTKEQLKHSIGDRRTRLPGGPNHAGWYIWSCVDPMEFDVIDTLVRARDATNAQIRVLKEKFLCTESSPRRKTGAP